MSNKFDKVKQVSSKCDDLNVEMKTSGKLTCGCGGSDEFEYDPNLFDCRLFGLFLRKAENSPKKYQFVLSKLNLLETALMEGKFEKTKDKVAEQIREIIKSDKDNTYTNDTIQFIIDYMNDNAKSKQDFNRYQLMATLQSALNYVEIARNPQLSQLLTIISNWVSKSDKIIKGVSVTQQEVNQDLILRPEDAQFQNRGNIQETDSRDAGELALRQEKAVEPYTDNDKFEKDKMRVEKIMRLLNTFNKALPGGNYFDPLSSKFNQYQERLKALKDETIYKKHFRDILYSGSDEKERLLFDIFRKLNEKMDSTLENRTSEESKKIKKALTAIFSNYTGSIQSYKSSSITNRVLPRFEFISNLYTFLLLSKELEKHPNFIELMEKSSKSKNSMKAKTIISNNLKKLLKEERDDYVRDTDPNKPKFPLQVEVTPTLNNITKSIQNTGKFDEDANVNTKLITQLIKGIDGKEKYIDFENNESSL